MKGKYIFMIVLLLLLKIEVKAQLDIATIETFIADHKNERSLLLARSTLETSNMLLHDYSKAANIEYKAINTELDKYTRAFDIIDLLVNSVHMAFNAKDTYEVISTKVAGYRKLLGDFSEKCLSKGNIYSTDTLIITINKKMLENVAAEGNKILQSLTALLGYATGAAACTTADLMVIVNSINLSMDNIKKYINAAYFNTWKYITMRTNLWKPQVHKAKSIKEITEEAFQRWIYNTEPANLKQ